jgi:type 1 fimbriae regulatory protein FimB/type 1 fimbriae regulatory protein FimE
MKSRRLKLAKGTEMRPVAATGRRPNVAYRVREHLTGFEVDRLLAAMKRNRHGHRDWLIGLLIYRHGLRVSEACDLRWDDVDLTKRTIIVRRLKGSNDSTHYLERDELAGLRSLQRSYAANGISPAYVFVNERGQPFGRMGIARKIERAGEGWTTVPGACSHAAAFDRVRPGGEGNGYAPAPALPGSRQHHQHGEVRGDVAGAV